jgi:hypothetical protein
MRSKLLESKGDQKKVKPVLAHGLCLNQKMVTQLLTNQTVLTYEQQFKITEW